MQANSAGSQLFPASAISAAQLRISSRIRQTPLLEIAVPGFNGDMLAKLENLQVTGSFKIRGALNALLESTERGSSGVVTYSAGNHGTALAHAAMDV